MVQCSEEDPNPSRETRAVQTQTPTNAGPTAIDKVEIYLSPRPSRNSGGS